VTAGRGFHRRRAPVRTRAGFGYGSRHRKRKASAGACYPGPPMRGDGETGQTRSPLSKTRRSRNASRGVPRPLMAEWPSLAADMKALTFAPLRTCAVPSAVETAAQKGDERQIVIGAVEFLFIDPANRSFLSGVESHGFIIYCLFESLCSMCCQPPSRVTIQQRQRPPIR
jgi:hypothetical protein